MRDKDKETFCVSGRTASAREPREARRGSNGGTTQLPAGKQWAPHCGTRQRIRNLQRNWIAFEKEAAKSDFAMGTRERLLDFAATKSQSELLAMTLALVAQCTSNENGTDIMTILNQTLNALEAQEDKNKAETALQVAAAAVQGA